MNSVADNRLCIVANNGILFAHQNTQCKLEIEIDEYPRNLVRINLDNNQAIQLRNFLNKFIGDNNGK